MYTCSSKTRQDLEQTFTCLLSMLTLPPTPTLKSPELYFNIVILYLFIFTLYSNNSSLLHCKSDWFIFSPLIPVSYACFPSWAFFFFFLKYIWSHFFFQKRSEKLSLSLHFQNVVGFLPLNFKVSLTFYDARFKHIFSPLFSRHYYLFRVQGH